MVIQLLRNYRACGGSFRLSLLFLPNEERRDHEGLLRNTALGSWLLFLMDPKEDLALFQRFTEQAVPLACMFVDQIQTGRKD